MMETPPTTSGVLGEHPDRCVRAQRRARKTVESAFSPGSRRPPEAVSSKTRQGSWYSHLQSRVGEFVRAPNGKSRLRIVREQEEWARDNQTSAARWLSLTWGAEAAGTSLSGFVQPTITEPEWRTNEEDE